MEDPFTGKALLSNSRVQHTPSAEDQMFPMEWLRITRLNKFSEYLKLTFVILLK
jgi:hypothetical protein